MSSIIRKPVGCPSPFFSDIGRVIDVDVGVTTGAGVVGIAVSDPTGSVGEGVRVLQYLFPWGQDSHHK